MIERWLKERRWFRAKSRGLVQAAVEETFPLTVGREEEHVAFDLVTCSYKDGGSERYVLPMARATGDEAQRIEREQPHAVVGDQPSGVLYDALASERLLAGILALFDHGGTVVSSRMSHVPDAAGEFHAGPRHTLVFRPFAGFDAARKAAQDAKPRALKGEQTNSSILYGDAFVLKIVRKLDEGRSAELEMGDYLTRNGYASAPPVLGAIEILPPDGRDPEVEPSTVGVLHALVPNLGDAWAATLAVLARAPEPTAYLPLARLLGRRVGEMHAVLAAGMEPSFVPEPIERTDRERLAAAVVAQAHALAPHLRDGDEAKISARTRAFVGLVHDPVRMRIHGDLHLGQILAVGGADAVSDFVVIDFEGEPLRSLAERRGKRSPLADVAGMLRSFDYAAATVLRATDHATARAWYRAVARAFLDAYASAASASSADPTFAMSLDFYLLEKCLYEIAYEADNRPDWIAIPKDGLADLLDAPTS